MAHRITFRSFDENFVGLLTRQDVIDMIEMFYDGPDTSFTIVGEDDMPGRRGSCLSVDGRHHITLSRYEIENGFRMGQRMGGNKKFSNLKAAALSVVAHELQHANQERRYKKMKSFWKGKYYMRPCERDARQFADMNEETIANMIDLKFFRPKRKKSNVDHDKAVDKVVESFMSCKISGLIDVKHVSMLLKVHGANNPVNIQKVVRRLEEGGKKVLWES